MCFFAATGHTSPTFAFAIVTSGSKLDTGGAGCRRSRAQSGNSARIFSATEMLASNMNSSTIEFVSLATKTTCCHDNVFTEALGRLPYVSGSFVISTGMDKMLTKGPGL